MKVPCPSHTREARPAPPIVNVVKTLAQIAAFWTFFLVLIPAIILGVESSVGVPHLHLPWLRVIGFGLFVTMGAIGITCGMIFAVLGSGTPLPLDTTTKLVIVGPYRHVRNPMAITGIL